MKTIKIKDALELEKSIFIDVRTEDEYREDHILNSINMPIFKNEEHEDIGTIYKQQGKSEAIKKGFDYVSYKLKDIYSLVEELSYKYENIVIYCARGGMRSGSICNMLSSLGMNVYQLEGGYKSYRNFVINYLDTAMDTKQFIVIHGLTGVGKTDMLKMLEEDGLDMIDLEGIAKNSGSTFGYITHGKRPPTQKEFETKIFEKLYFSKYNYIFIESESKRIGNVVIPANIYEGIIRDGYHLLLECSIKSRVDRLLRDYIYSDYKDKEALASCINKFRKRLGNETVDRFMDLFKEDKFEELIQIYLVDYYDPLYTHSVQKYTYNEVINCDNMNEALNIIKDFHKRIVNY